MLAARLTELLMRARLRLSKPRCPLLRHALDEGVLDQYLTGAYISERARCVYVSNPKTGSSSLRSALVELETRDQGKQVDPYDLDQIYGTGSPLALRYPLFPWPTLSQYQARGYAFVSFVRNPYTRLLSCYTNKIVPRGQALKHLLGGAAPGDFPAFARTVVAQRDRDMDTHWRPQTANLFHGQIAYAFLGRFESFADDFARVFEVLQIPMANRPASRHLNPSSRAGKSLAEFYSPEIQDLVYQRYRADFEAYGYPYELPEAAPRSHALPSGDSPGIATDREHPPQSDGPPA